MLLPQDRWMGNPNHDTHRRTTVGSIRGRPAGAKEQAFTGLVHHSDLGSQDVSIRYTDHLAEVDLTVSVGATGDTYNNALAETLTGLYKTESIYARPAWPSDTEVEFQTMNWVHW